MQITLPLLSNPRGHTPLTPSPTADSFSKNFGLPIPAFAHISLSQTLSSRLAQTLSTAHSLRLHHVQLLSAHRDRPDHNTHLSLLDNNLQPIEIPYYADFDEEHHRLVTDPRTFNITLEPAYPKQAYITILFVNAFTEYPLYGAPFSIPLANPPQN